MRVAAREVRIPSLGGAPGARAPEPGLRTFATIWIGQLVSLVGSGLTSFALGVWVYETTGSVTSYALILVSASLPTVFLLPFAGALVDRWDRRRTMMLSDTVSAAGTLALVGLLATGQLQLWHIYVVSAVNAVAAAFQWPAYSAATTLLVPKRLLGRAAGMVDFAAATARILSPLLAGFLVVTIRIPGVLLLDCATFLVAVSTLWLVRIPRPAEGSRGEGSATSLLQDIRLGWRYVVERPGLVRLLAFFSFANLFASFTTVLAIPLVLSFETAEVLGVTLSAGATGLLLGGLLMGAWGGPRRRIHGIVGSAFLVGLSMMVVGLRPWAPLVAFGLFSFYLWSPVINGCSQAIWQVKVPPHLQGRVFAIRRMAATSTTPMSYLLAGFLVDRVFDPLLLPGGALAGSAGVVLGVGPGRGTGLLFVLLGTLCLFVALWGLRSPRLMRLEEELPDAVPDSASA